MPSPLQTTIRDLHRPRGRERRGLTLAEGVRLVEDALSAGCTIEAVVLSDAMEKAERGKALVESLVKAKVRLERVDETTLNRLAETEHPQGIIAVLRAPRWSVADFDLASRRAVLVLDGVQDPGNTGTILRTALGLGAAGVIALPGTAELTNPKVVRGSMGALFRLPAVSLDRNEFLDWAREHSVRILAAEMSGTPIGGLTTVGPVAVVLGNEGAGLSPELRRAGQAVAIPIKPGAESLNVAVAAGILLYEVLRER